MYRLLHIDDDAQFCRMLSDYFAAESFDVVSIHDGRKALQHVLASPGNEYDLVLLDLAPPGVDAFEVLRAVRSRQNTPVIMLTGSPRPLDCIVGLETGADDYLVKPFDPRELLARVRAVLRRAQKTCSHPLPRPDRIVLGDIEVDVGSRLVRRNGEKLRLTSAEFSFLEILVRAAGQVVSRDRLARRALGRELGSFDRSIDMHVSRLRKKLGNEHNGIERIKTIRGTGFVYTIPDQFPWRTPHL
ncbi:MAG: response regulator transcription factor [Syntrophobacteraceae bacterium]|nr:response regulator transcription factor [Syntrophobacteraceae bacterium]